MRRALCDFTSDGECKNKFTFIISFYDGSKIDPMVNIHLIFDVKHIFKSQFDIIFQYPELLMSSPFLIPPPSLPLLLIMTDCAYVVVKFLPL